MFTDEQLELVANWQSAYEGFTRDHDTYEQRILPYLESLTSSGALAYNALGFIDLSNYYSFHVHHAKDSSLIWKRPWYWIRPKDTPIDVPGLIVYLSTLLPVGAIGRSTLFLSRTGQGNIPLTLNDVLTPLRGSDELVDAVLDAFADSVYRFCSSEELSQPLPQGVTPYEYGMGGGPWDRAFHALFADTD